MVYNNFYKGVSYDLFRGLGKVVRNLAFAGLVGNFGVNFFTGLISEQVSSTNFHLASLREDDIKSLREYRSSFGVINNKAYTDSLNALINQADSLSSIANKQKEFSKKSMGRFFLYGYFTD